MKIIWKIIIISIAVGLVLSMLGYYMGASRTLYWDRAGIYTTSSGECHITEPDLGEFKSIYVDAGFGDVIFVSSDKYGIELYGNNMEWFWTLEGGVLKISHNRGARIQIMNLNVFPTERNYAMIYLPDNTELETVSIKANSGDVKLGNFHATSVEINNSFGDVDISNTTSDHLQINLNSGRFTGSDLDTRSLVYNNSFGDGRFKQVNAESLTADSNSGDLVFTACEFGEMNIKTSFGDTTATSLVSLATNIRANSGDVNIAGEFSGETVLHADFGGIKLTISGEKDDYSYDISTKFGDVKFDGQRLGDQVGINSGSVMANHLKITASSGDVSVSFVR